MKKAILAFMLIAVTILSALLLPAARLADQTEIPIDSAQGSSNTDPAMPLRHLYDGDPATVWATTSTSPAEAWFEVRLARRTIIDYVEVSGATGGAEDVTILYADADGIWQPFLGRRHTRLDNGRIDLSWDQAHSDRLRFMLHNPNQAPRLGNLGEIKIIGHDPNGLSRITGVTSVSVHDPYYRSEFLTDGNTYTSWRSPAEISHAEITITLPEAVQIGKVKFLARAGAGVLSLQALVNGTPSSCFGPGIDLAAITGGWQSVAAPPGLVTDTILLAVDGAGSGYVGGLAEVEVWGRMEPETKKKVLLAENVTGQEAVFACDLDEMNTWEQAEIWATLPADYSDSTNIVTRVNGQAVNPPGALIAAPGCTLVKVALSPDSLRDGRNIICADLGTVTAEEISLVLRRGAGRIEVAAVRAGDPLPGLSDGYLHSGASAPSATLEVELASAASVDEIRFYGSAVFGGAGLSIWQGGAWVAVPQASLQANGMSLEIAGGTAATTKLRLEQLDANFAAALTEIEACGSWVNQGPPSVTITNPQPYCVLYPSDTVNLEGFVDNPETAIAVKVTAEDTPVTVPLQGHFYSYPIVVPAVANQFCRIATVTATDGQGRTGTAALIYNIHGKPNLTCTLPEVYYTSATEITVAGTYGDAVSVTCNAVPATLNGVSYTATAPLVEGENPIIIEARNNKNGLARLERCVIRDTAVPVIRVAEPVNGQTVTAANILVKGTCLDESPTTLTVNGQAVTVAGGIFTASVPLTPGANTITVQAIDAADGESIVTLTVDYAPMSVTITGPVEGELLADSSVTVKATVSGPSSVRVTANGTIMTPEPDGSYSAGINLPDGANTITVVAEDYDGTRVTETRHVTIDTQPPADFEIIVTPEGFGDYGWINNNKPTFSFATTDAVSGVDHYEIRIDNGAWSGPVNSPYQFTEALADGEHTVAVKVVDGARWERITDTTVKIDTVLPNSFYYFPVPGNGKVQMRWSANEISFDTIGYEVTRTPGFAEGNTIFVSKNDLFVIHNGNGEGIDVLQYEDCSVQNGTTYVYIITAIDHAGNHSGSPLDQPPGQQEPSQVPIPTDPITAGMTQMVVSPGSTGFIRFVTGSLMTSPTSLNTETRFTISEVSPHGLPPTPVGTVGPILDFKGEVQNSGQWVTQHEFAGGLVVALAYSPDMLPEGFDETLLGAAYYSDNLGEWVISEQARVDTERNLIYVTTKHLSTWVGCADPYVPDFTKDYGIDEDNYENYSHDIQISPDGGVVATKCTDILLPSPNNLTFGTIRIYNTRCAEIDQMLKVNYSYLDLFNMQGGSGPHYVLEDIAIDAFGPGWRLNLPYLCPRGHYHGFDGGAQEIIYPNDDNSNEHYDWGLLPSGWGEGKTFHGRDDLVVLKQGGRDGQVIVTLKNGIRITFRLVDKGDIGQPIRIEELGSDYWQEITYSGDKKLNMIRDSLQRELHFTYNAHGIDSISLKLPGQSELGLYHYGYNDKGLLTEVVDLRTNETQSYTYNQYGVTRGKYSGSAGLLMIPSWESTVTNYFVDVLNKICDQYGREKVFNYEIKRLKAKHFHGNFLFGFSEVAYGDLCVVHSRHDQIANGFSVRSLVNYEYEFEIGDPKSEFYVRQTLAREIQGDMKKVYSFKKFYQTKDTSNLIWQEETFLGDVRVGYTKYNYQYYGFQSSNDNHDPPAGRWLIVSTDKHINGHSYNETCDYDNWCNLKYRTLTNDSPTSPDDIVEWYTYKNTSSENTQIDGTHQVPYNPDSMSFTNIFDRVIRHVVQIKTPVFDSLGNSGTKLKECAYRYDSSGRIDRNAVWDHFLNEGNGGWAETQYNYDSGSTKPKQITDALGNIVYMEYDDQGNTIKTEQNVTNADGVTKLVTREWGYDPIWGWKVWEKSAWERDAQNNITGGYTTVYKYTKPDGTVDYKGRIWEIELPIDSDPPAWDPRSGPREGDHPVIRYTYNDVTQTKTVFDQLNNKMVYQFDGFGTLASIIKYEKTSGGNYEPCAITKITYNSRGQIETITDPNGTAAPGSTTPWKYTTRFEYNDLGNIIGTIYPDETETLVDNPRKAIAYDYSTGVATVTYPITDTLKNEVVETRNALGQVISREVKEADSDGRSALTAISYDGAGRQVKVENNRFDATDNELHLITLYLYDALGRQTAVISPEETFWENGAQVTTNPTITYEYDALGQKTAEIRTLPGGRTHRTEFMYDSLGRLIKTLTRYTDHLGQEQTAISKTYYDGNGNKTQYTDANGHSWIYTYDAANRLKTETDPEGHTTTYGYDPVGNRTSVTDPLSRTTWTIYNDLYRVEKIILPDSTPPAYPIDNSEDNPIVVYTYDKAGNVLTEETKKDKNTPGRLITYTYYPRYWVRTKTVSSNAPNSPSYETIYTYDKAGNLVTVEDPKGNTTTYGYDAQSRQIWVRDAVNSQNMSHQAETEYDFAGNKVLTRTWDANNNACVTTYVYNNYGKLTRVTDALDHTTSYFYDRAGNMTRMQRPGTPNGLITNYTYDELNRLTGVQDSLGKWTYYGYDAAGNRTYAQDPNLNTSTYVYNDDNTLLTLTVANGNEVKRLTYEYDEANQLRTTTQSRVFNLGLSDEYMETESIMTKTYSARGQVSGETRTIPGYGDLPAGYNYDCLGNITGIHYPGAGADDWLNYTRNELGQVTGIPGFTTDLIPGNPAPITYDAAGFLQSIEYANAIIANFTYDNNGRLDTRKDKLDNTNILSYELDYDNNGNILRRNDNVYTYDKLNQLLTATVKNHEIVQAPNSNVDLGLVEEDYQGQADVVLKSDEYQVHLDRGGSSMGLVFTAPMQVSRVELTPQTINHRLTQKRHLALYKKVDGSYSDIKDDKWEFAKDEATGCVTITLRLADAIDELKIHCRFDDRDGNYSIADLSQFRFLAGVGVKVFVVPATRTETYTYDARGNRDSMDKDWSTIDGNTNEHKYYKYYPNSDRLLTDGVWAFVYDANGNMVEKGNRFEALDYSNPVVHYLQTSDAIHWEYVYDCFNRLVSVAKNGTIVAKYLYDPTGLRIAKLAADSTVREVYTYDLGGNLIYRKNLDEGKEYSFVWLNGQRLARVDGAIGGTGAKYFYHNDHLGSPMVVTDQSGGVVWRGDHTPFGEKFSDPSREWPFKEDGGFTGKDWDEETGLFYFGTRWYNFVTGRFISMDID